MMRHLPRVSVVLASLLLACDSGSDGGSSSSTGAQTSTSDASTAAETSADDTTGMSTSAQSTTSEGSTSLDPGSSGSSSSGGEQRWFDGLGQLWESGHAGLHDVLRPDGRRVSNGGVPPRGVVHRLV
ncbi:MAG: hypothetical protein ACE37F_08655 [Nannocystaceae bacterium]